MAIAYQRGRSDPHPPTPSPKMGEGEPDSKIQSPSPILGEGFRVRATFDGDAPRDAIAPKDRDKAIISSNKALHLDA
ncbi:MAG: hypothetical protein ACRC8Y_24925, partial [Chroococcales cyanobacterium]